MDKIEELRGLLAAATAGPWEARPAEDESHSCYLFARGSGVVGYWNGHKDYHDDCNWLLTPTDAALIAALRNNAEALLARLESAERFIARLDEEIRRTAGGLPESWHHWQHTTYEQMRDWYFAAHDKDSR